MSAVEDEMTCEARSACVGTMEGVVRQYGKVVMAPGCPPPHTHTAYLGCTVPGSQDSLGLSWSYQGAGKFLACCGIHPFGALDPLASPMHSYVIVTKTF